jgi:hypothetical protein
MSTAIDSLRGILNGFRVLNSKGIYRMNATETDLLRQILLEVQALSLGGGVADGSITTPKLADGAVATVKILDANVTTAKIADLSVTPAKLSQPFTSGNAVAASGTAIDFTSIPSWAKRIEIPISGLSTNGTSAVLVQLGDSGGIETTGYISSTSIVTGVTNTTFGFGVIATPAVDSVMHGLVSLSLVDASTNTWSCAFVGGGSNAAYVLIQGGSKSLSAALDRVRLTTFGGDTFDAGSVRINYYG